MWKEMAQVNMNSVFKVNADEVIKTQKELLTVKNTCSGSSSGDMPNEKPYTKEVFEHDLKKASRKIKK